MARNAYPGKCYRCGLTVPAEMGHFERHNGGWRVRHHDYEHRATHATERTMTCRQAKSEQEKRA